MDELNPFLDQDFVKFPCVNCGGNSVKDYNFESEVSIDEFQSMDYVVEIDFGTYIRMNVIPDEETVRVYKCENCGFHIGYLPKSGCRYIP